jgi:ubiquinone/menaquinone biosynthesis C-methylase UbiE
MNSPRHARHTERTALALFEHIELPPQPICLEIGCGQGALTQLLVERFDARVIATDCDPDQVAEAQARMANLDGKVDFHVVDARAMPFDDAQFDAVFSFGVLQHILRGWRQAVAETARVLKPSGWFVFTDIVAAPVYIVWSGGYYPGWTCSERRRCMLAWMRTASIWSISSATRIAGPSVWD